jgi:hypothetical protein
MNKKLYIKVGKRNNSISLRFVYEKFTRIKRKSISSECQSKTFPGQLREMISLRLEFEYPVSFQVGFTSAFCSFFSRNVKKSYSKLFLKRHRNTGNARTWGVSEVLCSYITLYTLKLNISVFEIILFHT